MTPRSRPWYSEAHQAIARAANRVTSYDNPIRRFVTPAYELLLYGLSLGRGMPRRINGEEFFVDPRVRYLILEHHEAAVADFLRARVRPGQTCLNVGANLGSYALQLARWSAPDGTVVAFEPNRATAAILRRHVRMNGMENRIRVEPVAVGRAAGHAELFDTRPGSGISRIGAPHPYLATSHPGARPASIEVPVVSLDDYCAARGIAPDWLIVDVEGYEFEVLLGARETILRRGAALSILVEMHPYAWEDGARERQTGMEIVRELRRTALPLDGQHDPFGEAGVVALVCGPDSSDPDSSA
jgi:FkbM family methyltransferase